MELNSIVCNKHLNSLAADQTSLSASPRQANADKAQTIINFCLGDPTSPEGYDATGLAHAKSSCPSSTDVYFSYSSSSAKMLLKNSLRI